jgi:3-oxoacyl-[acyl-carrier protein] reductase
MSDAKTFVLTGCASGIGRHLADVLIARGDGVLATDINLESLEEHARTRGWPGERVLLRRLDVRDATAWEGIFQEAISYFGGIDVLLNVAGYLKPGWVYETDLDEVHRHFDINAKGVMFGTHIAARHMVRQRRGHIINFASMAALVPVPGLALYSATKYAVRAFSLAAAYELRPYGVSVTAICPDAVRTPMFDLQKQYDEAALTFSSSHPLSVEDIARVIVDHVLPRKPLEVAVPAHRGWLSKFVNLFPATQSILSPLFQRRARAHQTRLRHEDR